jgi:dihydrofolate synthase/folylpolyglutamate synthase
MRRGSIMNRFVVSESCLNLIVDGQPIGIGDVVRLLEEVRPIAGEMAARPSLGHPTFFEVSTAIAFKYFEERGVNFAVVEVGMGGRRDATNVLESLVSVITNVSLEHTKHLGETVLEIAREKAGIIKRGSTLVTAAQQPEVLSLLEEVCRAGLIDVCGR